MSVKQNELRFNNNIDFDVKIPNENKVIHVSKGKITYIIDGFVGINGIRVDLDSLKPITLTEEILLKCGFELDYSLQDFLHRTFVKNGVEIIEIKNKYYYNDLPIESVHQIQNLYFTLTTQELEVNF